MNPEPGDLLMVEVGSRRGETRLVIKTQTFVGVPETKETEALLLYPDGSMSWHSSKWLAGMMKKVGDNETR